MPFYKYPKKFMFKLIHLYLTGVEKFARQYKIHQSTLKQWVRKYEAFGEAVFLANHKSVKNMDCQYIYKTWQYCHNISKHSHKYCK